MQMRQLLIAGTFNRITQLEAHKHTYIRVYIIFSTLLSLHQRNYHNKS